MEGRVSVCMTQPQWGLCGDPHRSREAHEAQAKSSAWASSRSNQVVCPTASSACPGDVHRVTHSSAAD